MAKQGFFVRDYLKDSIGKQAAIPAGYSEHSAEVTASKWPRSPRVLGHLQHQVGGVVRWDGGGGGPLTGPPERRSRPVDRPLGPHKLGRAV
ncbi:terminase small subunit [Myxococcus fulvus]|uniref:terminase small subunit n=1 Tax=Myxococcus fulvus TaxID=33 RepID=UPI003B9BDAB3